MGRMVSMGWGGGLVCDRRVSMGWGRGLVWDGEG